MGLRKRVAIDAVCWLIENFSLVIGAIVTAVLAAAFGPMLYWVENPSPAFDAFCDSTVGHVLIVLSWIALLTVAGIAGLAMYRAFKSEK